MYKHVISSDLELRAVHEADAPEMFRLIDSGRAYLRDWLPWVDATRTWGDTRTFILKSLEQHEKNEAIHACIWYRDELAGIISLFKIDQFNRSASIGYWLGEPYQGLGLMTRSCQAITTVALDDLMLNRVEIQAAETNVRSRAVPERLGYTLEGIARQSTWLNDHFQDMAVYSMLRQDRAARQQESHTKRETQD